MKGIKDMYRNTEYISDGGNGYLVYNLIPGEELDSFANGMIMNNKIRGIMDYSYEIHNGVQRLRFVPGKGIALSTLIKRSLSKKMFLGIIKNIIALIKSLEDYMLDERGVYFNADNIYVDILTMETDLIYLPILGNTDNGSLLHLVRYCILSGVYDTGDDSTYLTKMINKLNSTNDLSVDEFGAFVDSLINDGPQMPGQYQPPAPQVNQPGYNYAGARPGNAAALPSEPVQPAAPVSPVTPVPQQAPFQTPRPAFVQQSVPSGYTAPPQANKDNDQKQQKIFGKLFKDNGSKKKDKPASASSDVVFEGMKIPGMNNTPPPTIQPQQQPRIQPQPPQPVPAREENRFSLRSKKSNEKNPVPAPYPQNFSDETVPAAPIAQFDNEDDGATVLIMPGSPTRKKPCFVNKDGVKSVINKNVFLIGKSRNPNYNIDLIVNNEHVGRCHATVEMENGVCYLMDNSSLNGTFVNGQRLGAGTKHLLKNGDKVTFADEEFTYRFD